MLSRLAGFSLNFWFARSVFAVAVVALALAGLIGSIGADTAQAAMTRAALESDHDDVDRPQDAQFQIRIGGGGIGIGGGGQRFGGGRGPVGRSAPRRMRPSFGSSVRQRAISGDIAVGTRRHRGRQITHPRRRGGDVASTPEKPRRAQRAGRVSKWPERQTHRPRRPKRPVIVAIPPTRVPPQIVVTKDPPRWRPGRRVTRPPHSIRPSVATTLPPIIAPPALVTQPPVEPPRAPVVVAAPPQDDIWPNELVAYVDTTTQPAGTDLAIAQTHNLERVSFEDIAIAGSRLVLYRIGDGRSVPALVAALNSDARVALVAPNFRYVTAQSSVSSARVEPASVGLAATAGGLQYALAKLRVPEARRIAEGRDVTVAVIDSGVDADHPALAGALVKRVDFAAGRGEPIDAHGTAIAGIIRAKGGVDGVAPGARIAAARAFFRDKAFERPVSSTYMIARSIYWAVEEEARVVNMSFAGPKDGAVAKAVGDALGRGVVLVAAAGNHGAKAPPAYPAAYPGVIAVTAVDAADKLYEAANRGPYVALAAPGVNVLVLTPKGGYSYDQGTSIAAAHVSGVIALLVERQPTLNTDEVRRVLAEHAVDLGEPGRDQQFGAGRVDALAAITSIRSTLATKAP